VISGKIQNKTQINEIRKKVQDVKWEFDRNMESLKIKTEMLEIKTFLSQI
jgi:hypothetical protein